MIELHDVSHAYESAVILRHITATLSEHRIGTVSYTHLTLPTKRIV